MDTWMNYMKVLKNVHGGRKKKPSCCLFSVLLSCCHCCHFPVSAGGAMTSLPNVFTVHCAPNDGTCAAVFSAEVPRWALSERQSQHVLKWAISSGHRFKFKLTRKADAAGESHPDGREGAACLHSGGRRHMLPLRQSVMGGGGGGGVVSHHTGQRTDARQIAQANYMWAYCKIIPFILHTTWLLFH